MKLRAVILFVVLGTALFFTQREEQRAMSEKAQQWFLDFLVANGREAFEKEAVAPSQDVVLIEFREEDKAEFSAWPPAPLDYIMVLKKLVPHEPEVVAFTMPLRWNNAESQFVGELQQALVPFPAAVLGFEAAGAQTTTADKEAAKFFHDELPHIGNVEGNSSLAPVLGATTLLPAEKLRTQMQLGFVGVTSKSDDQQRLPLIARYDRQLVPSLAVQALALQKRVPYASQRLRFGRGAGMFLGDDWFVPLHNDSSASVRLTGDLVTVNALELMTPDLEDETGKTVLAKLGKHKLVMLSIAPSVGAAQARAAAWALSLPRLKIAPAWVHWCLVGMACMLGFWQLRFRRMPALLFGIGMIVGGMMASLLVFQSSLVWWSPVVPLTAVLAATGFCFVWPNRHVEPEKSELAS